MPQYNILIGVDQKYYDDWGINLLKSINRHNTWIALHCHIVNPLDVVELPFVDYTYETIDFENEDSRIGYLQAVRFLAVADKFLNGELVITLDADTICTKTFTEKEFSTLFDYTTVLQHPKEARWLAGLVTFNEDEFRKEFAKELRSLPLEKWIWGRDQTILNSLADRFDFQKLNTSWLSIGKNKSDSVFLTLKGNQKETDKYLKVYRKYLNA
jgi:lipopolysaccharide biosynthesis glycosyltransferase